MKSKIHEFSSIDKNAMSKTKIQQFSSIGKNAMSKTIAHKTTDKLETLTAVFIVTALVFFFAVIIYNTTSHQIGI